MLYQRTCWQLWGCNWYRAGDADVPDHVFVRCPDGRGVDIFGAHPPGRHPDPVLRDDWKPVDDSLFERLDGGVYEAADFDRAARYVDAVLSLV